MCCRRRALARSGEFDAEIIPRWQRVVLGQDKLAYLRGFWGVLGNYLHEVKKRA